MDPQPPRVDELQQELERLRAELEHLRARSEEPDEIVRSMRSSLQGGPIHSLLAADLGAERKRELAAESRRKDEFLAMLAHELRNPIAPIRNAVEVLQLTGSPEPRVRWAKDMIDRQVAQLSRLVDDLLDLSRITRGKIRLEMRPVDLGIVVDRAIEMVRPSIDAREQELRIEIAPGSLRVLGDESRLAQVVSNMLHNAAKFTPKRGHIVVRLEVHDGIAHVVVEDDGVGIDPSLFGAIFDVFTQIDTGVERAQGGLGIGLALVRSVVEMHGGRVSVNSEGAGKGSEFIVQLPLLPPGAVVDGDVDVLETPLIRRLEGAPARRVLVVDDNVDAAESLMLLLRELGHDVRMLTQGRRVVDEALDFMPHAILLDIGLPDVSGYEVAVELRRRPHLAGIRLIALTGYGQADHFRRSQEAGFDRHWVKPIDVLRLQELLQSLARDESS